MKYDNFAEKFYELSLNDRLAIYNDYCIEHGNGDNTIYSFDEEFFSTFFSDPMEAARATYFGQIDNWMDEYIMFTIYGNLESLSDYKVKEQIDYFIEEIFEHPDCWEDYIDNDDDEVVYVCPECGHVFTQSEWDYNYDTALLDFHCPECDWEGNENEIDNEDDEED